MEKRKQLAYEMKYKGLSPSYLYEYVIFYRLKCDICFNFEMNDVSVSHMIPFYVSD